LSNADHSARDSRASTPVWHNVDIATFQNEIIPRDRPAILKGLVKDWPSVQEGKRSPQAFCDYLRPFDLGHPVQTAVGPPDIKGRLFYRDDMSGFNFERIVEPFRVSLERILAHLDSAEPPAVYSGGISTRESFPGFDRENHLDLVGEFVVPRIWASNTVTAPTHYDVSDNVCCVVGGHRRFTFFPPDQLPNLYVGPLDFTPAGQPTSMVKFATPDMERYPRYAQALASSETAELEPGDAVYIPCFWWHNVESLDPFNILINYWWSDVRAEAGRPFAALVHGIMSISYLPADHRDAWRKIFDHYVFQTNGDPVPHLAPKNRGLLGTMTPQLANSIKGWLLNALQGR
jgi:hypothetical protein